jgi:hypothetical protein
LAFRQVAPHCLAYNISARTTSKTTFSRISGVFTSPLPGDRRPLLLVAYSLEGVYPAVA